MNPTRTHIGPAVQLREVRLKGRVSSIFFSFAVSLAIFFLAALLMAGRSRLLEHAATMKPYAVAYRPTALPATAEPGSDAQRLVIFLGDSSVAQAPWAREDVPGIPDLLQQVLSESLPQARTALVADWSFAGARPFHYYCLLFEAEKHDPSLLIMPINWRSIGPLSDEWNKAFAFPELSSLVPAPERSMPSSEEMMRVEGISHSAQVLAPRRAPYRTLQRRSPLQAVFTRPGRWERIAARASPDSRNGRAEGRQGALLHNADSSRRAAEQVVVRHRRVSDIGRRDNSGIHVGRDDVPGS
jgi:hypothetical protein